MTDDIPWFDTSVGRAAFWPLVSIRTAVGAEMTCLLRLEYRAHHGSGDVLALQLAMTPEQSLALAEELVRVAGEASKPPPAGTPAH